MKIMPTKDNILVEFDKSETPSGIIIPEMAHIDLQQRTAKVIAIGPKVKDLSIGDKILLRSYGTLKRFRESNQALYPINEVYGIID